MTEISKTNFAADDFNPEKFIKDLNSHCIGVEELREKRSRIQELSDSTSAQLKSNVYDNYVQFIETAKEISHLESEIYQLSQLLCEQRTMLGTLQLNHSFDMVKEQDKIQNSPDAIKTLVSKEENKKKLIKVLENVEGAMSLTEISGRVCIHDGSLLELDPLEGTPLKRVHAYLFNDVLMIASYMVTDQRRSHPKYKMQVIYDLKSLAVVNMKDHGAKNLCFKLLAFPDTRVFQCPSSKSKKDWFEKYDQAKKWNTQTKGSQEVQAETKKKGTNEIKELITESSIEINLTEPLPEWILDIADNLDSCIAQRHFEEAYSLLEKAKNFIDTHSEKNDQIQEIKSKVHEKTNFLVSVLTKELESSAETKSLQGGGLRSARRAVKLLTQLNRSTLACQLYLKLCKVVIKAHTRTVKRQNSTLSYVRVLCAVVFSNIANIAKEFQKIFAKSTNCTSAFIVWCSDELRHLNSHLIKQIFIPQLSTSTLVECIVILKDHYKQLTAVGLDFCYQLDKQLKGPLTKTLQEIGKNVLETVKLHLVEDKWQPSDLKTSQNLKKLMTELDDLGIPLPETYIKRDNWISLTNSTLTFAKLYIGLLEDCLNVTTPEYINIIEDILIPVMHTQLQYLNSALNNPKLKHEEILVQENYKYVCNIIINRSLELYNSVTSEQFTKLIVLQDQYALKSLTPKPKPAPRRSFQKYTSTDYI